MMIDLASKLTPDNVESRNFLSFCLPSKAQLEDKGELNEWLECMMFLFEDVKWLLSLEVDKFWNQVVYDESWPICFDSFLQHAPRIYDLNNVPDACKVPLNKVGRLFLLAIKRMSIYDEEDNMPFSPDTFGELIYESYLFDAAKLLDICGIFYKEGDDNMCPLIEEIYENIFNCQPKYFGDMSHAVNSMMDTLSNIEERLAVTENVVQNEASKDSKYISGKEAQDIVMFLYDMAKTLKIFIDAFPKCSHVFFKSVVISKLAMFSEHSLSSLLKLIEIDRKKFKYMCNEIEKSFLSFVSVVITFGFVKRNQCTISDDEDLSAEFVSSMDSIGQCPKFLSGYYSLGNVDSDFQTIEKLGLLDHASLEYAKNMLGSIAIENDADQIRKELQDILPGRNVAFIDKCIETYGPKVDVIMNNIIEGNIIDDTIVVPVEKKPIHVPDKEVLEDKEHVSLLKATLLTNDFEDEPTYDMYDDEYDDTYDSHNVGATDVDDWEELTSRRKFTIPAALRQIGDVSSESDEDGEGNEEGDDEEKERESNESSPSSNRSSPVGQRGGGNQRGNPRGGRGFGRGGPGRGGPGRGRGGRGGRGRGGGNAPATGNQNQERGNANRGGNNRARGRGNSRGGHHNHRRLADKKKSQGMMPY